MAARAGWHPLPGGTGTSTVGVWRTVLGDQPVVVKRLAAPGRDDPGRAERSPALRLLAARRRRGSRRPRRRHAGPALARPDGRRGGRRGHHADPGVGRGRRQQRAVRGARAGPVRRRGPRRRALAGPRPAPGPARPVERRGGWRTLARTTVADVADHLWRRRDALLDAVRRAAAGAPARGPAAGQPAGPRRRRRGGDRLGHARPRARWAPTSATTCWRPREEFEPLLEAYLLGLPGRARDPGRGVPGRAGDRGLHRAQPRRVGAGPGRGRRGRAGREVPPPGGGAVPAALQRQFPQIEALLGREPRARTLRGRRGEGVAGLQACPPRSRS